MFQKRAICIITGSDFLAPTKPLFYQTGILNIHDPHQYLLLIYKFMNKNKISVSNSAYNNRNANNPIID